MKHRLIFALFLALACSAFAGVTTTHPAGESQIFTGFASSVPFFDSAGKLTPLTLGAGQAARRNAANTGFEAFPPQPLNANLTGIAGVLLPSTENYLPIKQGGSWGVLTIPAAGTADDFPNFPIALTDTGSGLGVGLYASALFDAVNQSDVIQVGNGEIHFRGVSGVYANDTDSLFAWKMFLSGLQAAKTANYTANKIDGTIPVNAAGGPITITLPLSSSTGVALKVVKIDNSANAVTIQRTGGDVINGGTSTTLTAQWQEATFTDAAGGSWIRSFGNNAGLALNNIFTGTNTFNGVTNISPPSTSGTAQNMSIIGQPLTGSTAYSAGRLFIAGGDTSATSFGAIGGSVTISGGANTAGGNAASGGNVFINGGGSTGSSTNGGNVTINGGIGSAGATAGVVNIGIGGTSWVSIGSSTIPTVIGPAAISVLRITSPSAPSSASATGTVGTIAWDASYLYVCTAPNTWKRVAIATW